MTTQPKTRQIVSQDTHDQLVTAAGAELDNILRSVNSALTSPLDMSCTGTNRVVNVGAGTIANPETSKNRTIPTITDGLLSFTSGTITLPGSGTGSAVASPGSSLVLTMAANQFVKIGVNMAQNGTMSLTQGTAAGTLAGATSPAAVAGLYSVGYIVARTDGSNNVQNVLASDLYQFTSSGLTRDDYVTLAGTQTLTNKTLDNQIIDNGATFLHETTPATPAAGRVRVYPKSDNSLYVLDSSGVETIVGSGSGAGEKNYITNPSAKSALTGWTAVGDFDLTRSTTLAELPREFTTAAGIKIAANSGTQSVADYVYFDFSLDDVDQSRKLKIQWAQKLLGAYNAGELAVGITTQADRTTFLHTPEVTAIPAADGTFTTSFDSGTTATLSLVIRATADMTTATGIVISDVIVGPGQIVQGAAVGPWNNYSSVLTSTGSTPVFGTLSINEARWRRVGDTMEISYQARQSATGTTGSGAYLWPIPTGYTIDTSKLSTVANSAGPSVGPASAIVGTTGYTGFVTPWDTTRLSIVVGNETTAVQNVGPGGGFGLTSTAIVQFAFTATVPIAEWAGSGINLGSNDIEYASNTSTSDADDSTSFGYGPAGSVVPTVAASATTAVRTKRVRFQTPIQSTDNLEVEIQESGTGAWLPLTANDHYLPVMFQTPTLYGITIRHVSGTTTDIDVCFSRGGRLSSGAFGVAGSDYPRNATDRYRVVKSKAGAAVGFGLASATQAGLVTLPQGSVFADTHAGSGTGGSGVSYGSTNTYVPIFSNATTVGTSITRASTAAAGDSYTINEAGIYTINFGMGSTSQAYAGITKNGDGTTQVYSQSPISKALIIGRLDSGTVPGTVSATVACVAGDVIRPHWGSTLTGSNPTLARFSIIQIAKQ